MPGINLGYAMTLPPKKAIAYFEARGYHIAFDTTAMEDAAHATGFTVSGILKQDVLADINGALGDALKNGQALAQFKDTLQPVLARKGWIGSGLKADEDGVLEGKQLMPYRLDTIFRTNMQSAYMAGRYQRMMDNAQSRPYWEYDAVMDNRTRPAHAAMNGRVYRCDDPIWDTFFPPNGYNCRCSVRALNARDLSRHPITCAACRKAIWSSRPRPQTPLPRQTLTSHRLRSRHPPIKARGKNDYPKRIEAR